MIKVALQGGIGLFAALPGLLRSEGRNAIGRVGKIGLAAVRQSIRTNLNKRPTGALARSYTVRYVSSNDTWVARIESKKPYARIHETGGIIRAQRAPYLVFQIDRRWSKKKRVRIPARRYLTKARDAARLLVRKEFKVAVKTAVKKARRKRQKRGSK